MAEYDGKYDGIPAGCYHDSYQPPEPEAEACSACGKRDAEGDACEKCGTYFCKSCSALSDLVIYCDGCHCNYCADCSETLTSYVKMLAELRTEVKTVKGRLELAMLALKGEPQPQTMTAVELSAAAVKRIEAVLSMGSRSSR